MLQRPLLVTAPHTRLSGRLRLVAHERQSYDIHLTLSGPPLGPGQPPQTSSGKFDLKDPYYRCGRVRGQGVRQGTTCVRCAGAPPAWFVLLQAAKYRGLWALVRKTLLHRYMISASAQIAST